MFNTKLREWNKRTWYQKWHILFFWYINKINNLEPKSIKVDERSYKSILIYYIGYVKPNTVKTLLVICNRVNGT